MRFFFAGKANKNSIIFKISAVIAVILVIMIMLLLFNNIYSYRTAARGAEEQQKRVMSIHTQQIVAKLDAATATLNELALNNLGKVTAFQTHDDFKRYLSSMDMTQILTTKTRNNENIACLYFAYPEEDVYLYRYASSTEWQQKFAVDDYIKEIAEFENDAAFSTWHTVRVGQKYYMMQNYAVGPANIGVLIAVDNLLSGTDKSQEYRSVYMITDETGKVLATENPEEYALESVLNNPKELVSNYSAGYTIFTQALPRYSLRISCAVGRGDIYQSVKAMQLFLFSLSILAVFAIVFFSRYLNRQIVEPVKKLAAATKEIEKGNIDYRIPADKGDAYEFEALISSFNNMTQEIKELKIQTYEETLERKNAELKYLQMQLSPHFYLNAINTISSLSISGKHQQIQEFIVALSAYLRYLFTDNLNAATVKTEIMHAVDFLELQQIRYPNNIFYFYSIEPDVEDIPVEKLLFQTFVENIFKHAFDGETGISIFIRAQRVSREDELFALISIEDTGCGFPLPMLEDGLIEGGKNIGIANIAKTLQLAYGRDDLLHLSNNEQGGARVEIFLPLAGHDVKEP